MQIDFRATIKTAVYFGIIVLIVAASVFDFGIRRHPDSATSNTPSTLSGKTDSNIPRELTASSTATKLNDIATAEIKDTQPKSSDRTLLYILKILFLFVIFTPIASLCMWVLLEGMDAI